METTVRLRGPVLRNHIDVRRLLPELADAEQEHFFVLGLDAKNRVVVKHLAALGTANNVTVCPRDVFRELIRQNAVSCIVAHNHPSGDAQPSPSDLGLTDRLVQCGRLVGIEVLDHLIVGEGCSYSFAEHGLIEEQHTPTRSAA